MPAGVGGFFASFVGKMLLGFLTDLLFGLVKQALFGKEQTSSLGLTLTVTGSDAPHKLLYGEQIVSGNRVFIGTSANAGDPNGHLHMVIVLACHEVAEIGEVYLDNIVETHADFQGPNFGSFVRVNRHLGTADQEADPDLLAEVAEWTVDHRLRGCAYVYVRLTWRDNPPTFASGFPNIKARVRGKLVYDFRDGVTRWSNNAALCAYDYLMDQEFGRRASLDEIHVATAIASANVCDEMADLSSKPKSIIIAVDLTANTITLATGALELKRGDRVQLFGTGTPPAGVVTGTSYYWIPAGAALNPQLPVVGRLATTLARARSGLAINLVNEGSGERKIARTGQPRYCVDGAIVLSPDRAPLDHFGDMLTAMAGAPTYTGGQYRLHAGAEGIAVHSIDESDLRGDLQLRARTPAEDLFNEVRGTFADLTDFGAGTTFPPVVNSLYVEQDGGDDRWRNIELPFTNDSIRAQRIAKQHLEQGRQGIEITLPCKVTVYRIAVWDVVLVSLAHAGWVNKPFRVMNWKRVQKSGNDGIDLSLREYAASVYDWNYGMATLRDPAPDTQLPNWRFVGAPGLTLSDDIIVLGSIGGPIVTRLLLDITPPTDTSFISGYSVEYRLTGTSSWRRAGNVDEITGVQDGANYDVRVRAINSLGGLSDWTQASHFVLGKSAPPPDVTQFVVEETANFTRRFWWQLPDAPIDLAGFRLKANLGPSRNWAAAMPLHNGVQVAAPFEIEAMRAGLWTVLIKAVDTSGNESANAAVVVINLGDAIVQNIVDAIDIHAAIWPGTKTACAVEGGTGDLLATDTSGLMWAADLTLMWTSDPQPLWGSPSGAMFAGDARGMWEGDDLLMWSPTYPAMQYRDSFAPEVEGLFLFLVDGEGEIFLEYKRGFPDGMWSAAASPMWTASAALFWHENPTWIPWTTGVYVTMEPIDVRISIPAGSTRGRLTECFVGIDAPDVVDRIEDAVIAAGGTRLPLFQEFRAIRLVNLTLQDDGGTAVTAKVLDKDETLGPLVRCFNAAGAGTAGLVDAIVQGY